MENKNMELKVLVVILCILVLGLGGYILYDKVLNEDTNMPNIDNKIDNNENNDSDLNNQLQCSKTVSEISGRYKDETDYIHLELYKNGVFVYTFNKYAESGSMGNYVVDGDKIILTYWFNTGSDVSLGFTKGTKTLYINSDGSITDSKVNSFVKDELKISEINLVFVEELYEYDAGNRMATGFATEENHKSYEPEM